jgi:putative effector of murein hydrolase LrgA (UPF0299 family)
MRDIPGHILGVFFLLVVNYYAFAFVLSFGKDLNGNATFDIAKGSGFALIYMVLFGWLPAAVATATYFLMFRARWWATLALAAAAAALLYTIARTGFLDERIQLALFVWCVLVAVLAHHAAVTVMRLFVGTR